MKKKHETLIIQTPKLDGTGIPVLTNPSIIALPSFQQLDNRHIIIKNPIRLLCDHSNLFCLKKDLWVKKIDFLPHAVHKLIFSKKSTLVVSLA